MNKDRTLILLFIWFLAGGLIFKPFAAMAQNYKIKENLWLEKLIRYRAPEVPTENIKILIIGDVMLHKAQIDKDYKPFLSELDSAITASDLAIANMEFPLGGKPYTGYPSFSSPTEYAKTVSDLGIDVFLTANNHILDRGAAGLKRTLKQYASLNKPLFTGTASADFPDSLFNPLVINVKGIKVALVNVTYGTNYGMPEKDSDIIIHSTGKEDTKILLERARKAGADIIIALPHWGTEYALKHNRSQEEYARWLAEEGADAIIGAHPHVVQDTCNIKTSDGRKVPVVYSLGNAVSNMSAKNTRLELAATITLEKSFPWEIRLSGVKLDFLWCTLPGTLTDNYKTIYVHKYLNHRDLWKRPEDYDNMVTTLERVKRETGIEE